MTWTENALAKLRELTGLGLPASRIAEQLHTTTDAVHGARFRNAITVKPPPEPEPAPPLREPPYLPGAHECRYILDAGPWKGRSPQWCAERVLPGSPYCPEHHRRCYAFRAGAPK